MNDDVRVGRTVNCGHAEGEAPEVAVANQEESPSYAAGAAAILAPAIPVTITAPPATVISRGIGRQPESGS